MSKINYITREDGMPAMITAESDYDFIDTEEILEDYPYLIDSMNRENYYIENDFCFAFDELLYENKVVGFATFELNEKSVLILNECYIMPEFRSKGIFFDEICKMLFSAPEFGIMQPTRNLVELLIEYSFAKKITDDIVASGIDFYFNEIHAKSNKRDELFDEIHHSNFYDLKICSTILLNDNEIIYHDLSENDMRNYGKREKITEDYFNDTTQFFVENDFENTIQELKENLPEEKLTYGEIIGDGDGLSQLMQGIVDNGIISHDKALEIKEQLINEYESGRISDENIEEHFTEMIMSDLPESLLMDEFQEHLDSSDEGFGAVKEFFELIGDNEELANGIFNAMLSDDEVEFENLIVNEMNNNEEFSNRFMDMVNDWDGDETELPDEDYLDLNSLGLNMDSQYPIAEMMWGPNDDKYKLDDTYYGKDYPISHDIYIFRVLKSLKKHENLKIALASADMKGAMTAQAIESQLFALDFINNEVNYDNWDEFANECLTVNDLKNILRENSLKISGKKQELIDRIAKNKVPINEFRSEKVTVTPDGDEFIKENEWIEFYDTILDKFDFNDFVKYMDTHNGEFIELSVKYLQEHFKIAEKENNAQYMTDCRIALEMISAKDEKHFKNLEYTG